MRPVTTAALHRVASAPRPVPSAGGNTWAILLAGGEGKRLSGLVERIHPDHRPKQYATIIGTRSMLQHTYARALAHAAPGRVLAVITEGQERWALSQLPELPARNFLIQPRGLDTGPAVLFALAHILEREPDALALLLPCDHFIFPEPDLRRPIAEALAAIRETETGAAVLLAARPTGPRCDVGWILPGETVRKTPSLLKRVLCFIEKPPREVAESLLAEGALWNTFIMAGRARGLHRLIEKRRPEAAERMARYLALRREDAWRRELDQAYGKITPFNLSSQVLAREPEALLVAPLGAVEWNDWGTPEGIQETLASLGWSHRSAVHPPEPFHAAAGECSVPPCMATAGAPEEEASP
ncbi:MAG: sugar phosphate nucleotidyltransferase [Nitrospinota bacterium]